MIGEKLTTFDEYNAKIEKNYRWNFFWMALDNMMFFFIFMGLSPYTILPFYIQHFTDSKILIGLLSTIYLVGTTAPQLFMANFLNKKKSRKRYLLIAAIIQRFGILGLFLLSLLQPRLNMSANLTLVIFFLMFTIQHTASGFYVPAWIDFMGKAIPRKRGLLFGLSNFIGGLMGLGMGWLLSYLLDLYPFEQAVPVIFGISLFASLVSLIAIISWREVVPPNDFFKENDKIIKDSYKVIFKNKNFMQYLLWRSFMVILEIATPFYTLSAIEHLQIEAAQIGIFTTILSFSEAVVNPFWGWLGDRGGFLYVLKISGLAGILGAFLAVLFPNIVIYYVIFFLLGIMISGIQISSLNIIFEFSPSTKTALYTAVSQVSLTPISSVVALVGGFLAEHLGYSTNYWLAGSLGLFSLIGLSIFVKNPKARKQKKST